MAASPTTISAGDLRERMSDTLNTVAYGGERILVMRHGRAVAALIPVDDLRDLEQREALEDEADLRAVRERADEPSYLLQDVLAELDARDARDSQAAE